MSEKITPNLWFDTEAEQAAEFYVSVFGGDSEITSIAHYTESGPREEGMVMVVEFKLRGQHFVGINGGPEFNFDEAVSFQISCEDQAEVDYFWEKLTAGGGREGQCGWLTDKYGLAWQVTPRGMDSVFSDPDKERANRAMKAMLGMRKINIAELQAAADGR
jgi:predicted 3-demethylubiquinone-9 3-methyltransferase (glyoxalase superfamily)